MTRRKLIKSMVGAAMVPLVENLPTPVKASHRILYGRITVGDKMAGNVKSCTVNGIDVIKFAFDGDDREGWVKCHQWTDYPNPPSETSKIFIYRGTRKVTLHGEVRFTFKDKLPGV